MAETFAELYAPLLKEVFTVQARQQLDAGADGMTLASEYAEHGTQFHRPFPLIKLEAQKDRLAARQVRQGRRVRRDTTAPKMFGMN